MTKNSWPPDLYKQTSTHHKNMENYNGGQGTTIPLKPLSDFDTQHE